MAARQYTFSVVSFGPAKILLVLMVALIVLGPEKLPQMARQIGKAWGDFRRFREHLESEVRGAFGEDLAQTYTPPWSPDAPSLPSGAEVPNPDGADGASGSGSTRAETVEDRAPPPGSGQPTAPQRPAAGSGRTAGRKGWDPGMVPDDPSLN